MHRTIEQNAKKAATVKNETNLNFQFLQRGIEEFSTVSGFLYQNTAGFSNYRRKMIFALSLAKNSRIISINWHSRLSLCVGSKAYIIGMKGTNLKEGVFNTLFMPTAWL